MAALDPSAVVVGHHTRSSPALADFYATHADAPRIGFDTGPQFVFNFGGGPGIRVHQFGGARPRRRPREGEQGQQESSFASTLIGLLPILLLFVFPIISSLFSGATSGPAMPSMVFDKPLPPFTHRRTTKNDVKYFVNPKDKAYNYFRENPSKMSQLDHHAEVLLVRTLRNECEREMHHKQMLREDAQGWFVQDAAKMKIAEEFEMKSCQRLDKMAHLAR